MPAIALSGGDWKEALTFWRKETWRQRGIERCQSTLLAARPAAHSDVFRRLSQKMHSELYRADGRDVAHCFRWNPAIIVNTQYLLMRKAHSDRTRKFAVGNFDAASHATLR